MENWHPIHTAPLGQPVQTKIDDQHGARNHAVLTKKGHLWFTEPEGGMYVYYQPTHWRPLSNGERGNG